MGFCILLFTCFLSFSTFAFSFSAYSQSTQNVPFFTTDFSNLWLPRSGILGIKGFHLNEVDSIKVNASALNVSFLFRAIDSLALFIPLDVRTNTMRLRVYKANSVFVSLPFYYCPSSPVVPTILGSSVRVACSNNLASLVCDVNDFPLLWSNGVVSNILRVNVSGVYAARMLYTDVCNIGTPAFGNRVRVNVNNVPAPVIRPANNGFVEVLGVDTLAGPSFFWFLNDSLVANTLTRFYFNDAWNGSLRVDILYDGGCRASSSPILISRAKTGFNVPSIKLFPNPASEVLTLEGFANESVELSIFSINGNFMERVLLPAGGAAHRLSLSAYPKGVYLLKGVSKGIPFVQSFVRL